MGGYQTYYNSEIKTCWHNATTASRAPDAGRLTGDPDESTAAVGGTLAGRGGASIHTQITLNMHQHATFHNVL